MQIVHSLNELERIPHNSSRLKLFSYIHSRRQMTIYPQKIKNIHILFYFHHFICRSLLLEIRGEGIKMVRPRNWIIIKLMAPHRPASAIPYSSPQNNLSPTLFPTILNTLISLLDRGFLLIRLSVWRNLWSGRRQRRLGKPKTEEKAEMFICKVK